MSKILLATNSLDIGGAETHVAGLACELCRRGHDVTVVSAGGAYVQELSEAGAKHYWAPLDTRKPHDMAKSLGVLSFLVKTERFDIVHAHARIPAFLCGILRRLYKFNFVTTAHWQFASHGLQKRLSNWGSHVIAVSEDIKQYLISIYGIREEDITVTVNGIDTGRFSPAVSGEHVRRELEIPDCAPVLVCVARLDHTDSAPTAMVQALIDAAPELGELVKGLRIVIAGGGDREPEFREKAACANAQAGRGMIIMTGPRTDINEVLTAGDLFVGVSRAALEAMSVGLPVILAGGEGYLGVFKEEIFERAVETNFTCRGEPATEKEALCRDAAEFFSGFGTPAYEGRSARLGAYGRETVVKFYSVSRMVDDCELVYARFSDKKKYRIAMSGYYGFDNAGDEAIMQAVYNSIMQVHAGAEITVLSKSPASTKARFGYRSVGRFNPFHVVWVLRRCDALVFGGGSLLQDNTSTRSLMYYLTIIRIANFFKKPVMIYANGIGPLSRPKNRERVRLAVGSAKIVTLRDVQSLEELRQMGVTRDDIEVTGDPVYTIELPSEDECLEIVRDVGIDLSRPFAAVSVRKNPDSAQLFPELAKLCDMIYSQLGIGTVFLPMQPAPDIAASREVRSLMSSPAAVPECDLSPRELVGILSNARFAISMRFHTLVFAARAGTPWAGIIVDPKIEANLEAFGMPGLGAPSEVDANSAFETIKTLLSDREKLSKRLKELSDEQCERTKIDAKKLSELPERLN